MSNFMTESSSQIFTSLTYNHTSKSLDNSLKTNSVTVISYKWSVNSNRIQYTLKNALVLEEKQNVYF